MPKKKIFIKYETLREKIENLFYKVSKNKLISKAISDSICENSLRGIDSHGVRLFSHYLNAIIKGRLNTKPKLKFTIKGATISLDANHAPGQFACIKALEKSFGFAKKYGICAISVKNSSHFGTASHYALKAANKDLICFSFTNATAHVNSFKGTKPIVGNNPICLCAPMQNEDPFCLDMATTKTTFNGLNKLINENKDIPFGIALDKFGKKTTIPSKIFSLVPIGQYKGFGLSVMVDILCSILADMPSGPKVSSMFGNSLKKKRKLGHFFILIDINKFIELDKFKKNVKKLATIVRKQRHIGLKKGIFPGDPEKENMKKNLKQGIFIDNDLLIDLNFYFKRYKIKEL